MEPELRYDPTQHRYNKLVKPTRILVLFSLSFPRGEWDRTRKGESQAEIFGTALTAYQHPAPLQ